MSTWNLINSEDIEVDVTAGEVYLLTGEDIYGGNEYTILTFDQVKEIYKQVIPPTVKGE